MCYYNSKEFRFLRPICKGGLHMKNEEKIIIIINYLKNLSDDDLNFILSVVAETSLSNKNE